MSGLDKIRIRCDSEPWVLTITNADTGEPITCVTRVEYVNELNEHYVKLWVDASDVDIDITAPAEIVEEKETEGKK